jgi:hypothetical protein
MSYSPSLSQIPRELPPPHLSILKLRELIEVCPQVVSKILSFPNPYACWSSSTTVPRRFYIAVPHSRDTRMVLD